MGHIIKDVPKPMAPVGGKPFLEYLILWLVAQGIKKIILSIGYKGDIIKSYFGSGINWGSKIEYCDEKIPLGTGGALKKASNLIDDKVFCLLNGDSFLDVDVNEMMSFHRKNAANITMGLTRVNDLSRYGMVEINDKREILRIVEKGSCGSGLINGGVYILNKNMVKSIPDGKISLEKDVLAKMLKSSIYGTETKGFFIDIGTSDDYLYLCNNPNSLIDAVGSRMVLRNQRKISS